MSVAASSPRVREVPGYEFTAGDEAIDLAESVGLVLDGWQRDAVRDILATSDEAMEHWNSFESALIVPRQNGKGAVLEALELYELFVVADRHDYLIVHTAHEFKTAQEAFRRIRFLIENSISLMPLVRAIPTAAGNEGIELKAGPRLRFLARSGAAGRGFSADRLIYDEAYDLPAETVAASLPTLSAKPNPGVLYTSSAPLDTVKSDVLRRVMRRGRREPENRDDEVPEPDRNLCYIEYSADPRADLDDRDAWTQANPGVASDRITLDFIAKERGAMSEIAFARERLGILDESKGATVIDMGLWDDLAEPDASPLDPVAFAIDVNPDSSFTSIAVAGRTADSRLFGQVVDRRRGTGWVVDRVEELIGRWHPSSVALDAIGPAGSLLPAFSERGIDIRVLSMTEYGRACGAFKSAVDERQFVHNGQSGLRAALEAARKRPLGDAGAWGWHRRDTTDITPLVAVTLATFAFADSRSQVAVPAENQVIIFR